MELHPAVQPLISELSQVYRELHQCPELQYDLPTTSNFVANYLENLGLEVHRRIGQSGVVAILKGQEGPTLLLRADMDALPIQELNSHNYVSKNLGVMHACGHDAHTTMLLVASKVLAGMRESIKGTVKFCFQPAEEGGHGARAMIKDPSLDLLSSVSEVYAVHLDSKLEVGDYLLSDKFMSCYSDIFSIEVFGKGGHASAPHCTIDPLPASAQLITGLQTIVSRNIDPKYKAVVSTSYVHGGEAYNAIPDSVAIKGSVRSYEPEVKQTIKQRMEEICQGVQSMSRCKVKLNYTNLYFPIVNSARCISNSLEALSKVAHGRRVKEPPMIGEDFSYFTEEREGCYLILGSGNDQIKPALHSANFEIDERVLGVGTSYWVRLIEERLIN